MKVNKVEEKLTILAAYTILLVVFSIF